MDHDQQVELELSKMLDDRMASVSELALGIRREIVKLAPGVSELLYRTYAVSNVFTYTGKLGQAFIHIATYKEHVNLGFNQGVKLPDPQGLLEGTGKLIRHIRIENFDAVKTKPIKTLVNAAIKLGRSMANDAGGIQAPTFHIKSK